MNRGEITMGESPPDRRFAFKSHAAPALLEAGQGYSSAPICQRRMSYVDAFPGQNESRQQMSAPPGTEAAFHCTGKDGTEDSFVKTRLQNAAKLWVALAACVLLCFLALGIFLRHIDETPFSNLPSPEDDALKDNRNRLKETSVTIGFSSDPDGLHGVASPQPHTDQLGPHPEADKEEQFEDEDDLKQHPDDPSFIDAWDGEEAEYLDLSRGIEGLKTPLYRLPFVEGQHNETHAVGLHSEALPVPRYLVVDGGRHISEAIGGSYTLMMTSDGRPKPLLVHGRPIWRRAAKGVTKHANPYLFYDHTHHTWVFNKILDFQNPHPLAFLPHGALIPVIKTSKGGDKTTGEVENGIGSGRLTRYVRHGVPASVHWIVREEYSGVPLRRDDMIRVTGDPAHAGPQDFFTLSIQKVFHAREDEELHLEDEDDELADEEAHDADLDEEDDENKDAEEDFNEDLQSSIYPFDEHSDIFSLPASTRTRQHFLTHPLTLVYHTFELLHPQYPHATIVKDPIDFLEKNSHPDVETVERHFGEDSTAVPHPLRTS